MSKLAKVGSKRIRRAARELVRVSRLTSVKPSLKEALEMGAEALIVIAERKEYLESH